MVTMKKGYDWMSKRYSSSMISVPDLYLDDLVIELLAKLEKFDAANNFGSNIVDPYAAALEASVFRHATESAWRESELHRQKQKALMNYVGQLHQSIIGCLPGWESFDAGSDSPDVVGVRGEQRIIAEIKNKHNTMNSNSAGETYDKLVEFLERREFKGFIGVVVHIIGPVSKETHWKPFAPGKNRKARSDLIVMNGRPFYALAVDEKERQPGVSVKPDSRMESWSSWSAIDEMTSQLFSSIARNTGATVPKWVEKFIDPAIGT